MELWNKLLSDFSKNSFYGKRIDSVSLLLGLTVIIFTAYFLRSNKRKKLPPGPTGLPIFGYYFSLRKKPIEALEKLSRKYGNVIGLYIGNQYTVFLNDWEAVKEAYSQNATLDRPFTTFTKAPYKFGFGGANGEEWSENRRLASKVLKDGLERNNWEDHVEKGLNDTVELLRQHDGKPIELRGFFCEPFTDNVVSLVIGERAQPSVTKMVTRSVDFLMENFRTVSISMFSNTLTRFLTMLGIENMPSLAQEVGEFVKFVSDTVDSYIEDPNSEKRNTLISRFQAEMEVRKKNKQKSHATVDSLKGSVMVFMVGGSETTRTSIIWALIAMAEYPDKQAKVHEELDAVIGRDRSIRWSERSKVPYTLATILETLRWKPTGGLPALRMASEDMRIQGYHIPKGTYIGINLWLLSNDTKYWKNPSQFIPERFLLEDGRKVNMAPESYIPFSYGKRNCPGKLLALMNMLQYFTTLMQNFKVVPKEGDKVKYHAVLGLSYQARNAELRFIPR